MGYMDTEYFQVWDFVKQQKGAWSDLLVYLGFVVAEHFGESSQSVFRARSSVAQWQESEHEYWFSPIGGMLVALCHWCCS